jgi:UDP-N-acetyl-D-glucosamine/UDP-N-acetyl-D-galactosamine dehydrogenase
LNIALMNELAIVFGRLGLDTSEVLEAAATKWNFLPFRPGLVGGHCIGVDPYYLTHKAEMVGYHPQVILAGRRINDGMAAHVADMTIRHLVSQGGCHRGDAVTVLGLTFKEDCPDIRNSKVADLIGQLLAYGLDVSVHDPIADPHQALEEYTVALRSWDELPARPRAVIVAVAHREYKIEPDRVLRYIHPGTVVMDVKAILDPRAVRDRGGVLWRL